MVQLCGHGKECCNASYKSKPNSRYKKCQGEKCGKPACPGCKLEAIHLTASAQTCLLCTRKICCEGCMTKCPHKNMLQLQADSLEGQLQLAALAGAAAGASGSGTGFGMPAANVHTGGPQAMLKQSLQRISSIENGQQVMLSRLNALEASVNILTQTISISFALQAGQPGNQAQAQALSQLLASQLMAPPPPPAAPMARSGAAMDLQQQQQQPLYAAFSTTSNDATLADMLIQHHQHLMQQQQQEAIQQHELASSSTLRTLPKPVAGTHPSLDLSQAPDQQQQLQGHSQAAHDGAAAAAMAQHPVGLDGQGVDGAGPGDTLLAHALQASVEHAMQALVGSMKAEAEAQQQQQQQQQYHEAQQQLQQQQQQQYHEAQQQLQQQQQQPPLQEQAGILLPILPLNNAQQQLHSTEHGGGSAAGTSCVAPTATDHTVSSAPEM